METLNKDIQKIIKRQDEYSKNYILRQKEAMAAGNYPQSFVMPLSVQYELTSKCNMYCRHCYNRSGDNQSDKMDIQQWKKLSKELTANGGIFQCILSGGEPLLLDDDLFEIMDILDADGTIFILITNGYLLTKEIIKKLKKYRYQWIQVSIDGASAKTHDELRQKAGSWEKAVNAALMVADAGLPLAIAHSIIPNEIDELPKMAGLAYQCGASLFIVGEVFPSGRAAINTELLLNMEQKVRLWDIVEKMSLFYNGRMVVARSTDIKIQLNEVMELPNTGIIVRPNGDIRLECTAPFVIGNVLTSSFLEQWTNGKDKWKHEKVVEFINSVDQYSGISTLHTNHIGEDIYL